MQRTLHYVIESILSHFHRTKQEYKLYTNSYTLVMVAEANETYW